MREVLFLIRKQLGLSFRSREVWLWTFVMPVLFFYFIGAATSGMGRSGPGRDTLAVWSAPDAGFLADELVRRLESLDYRVVRAATLQDLSRHQRRIILPARMTERALAGEKVAIEFTRGGDSAGGNYDDIRVNRALYSIIADLIVLSRDRKKPAPQSFQEVSARPRNLKLTVQSATRRADPPSGYNQSVPGSMTMFVLLVMFTTAGVTLVQERKQGILRRLASSPLSRGAVVTAKWGSRFALGVIQVIFAMVAGSVLFGVNWGPNLLALAGVLILYTATAAALGVLLGNVSRSEGQAVGIGVVAANILAALGGCYWPIEITPLWAQRLALVFPTGWVMDAIHKLVHFGFEPQTVIPHALALAALGLLSGWLVARTFRFQ